MERVAIQDHQLLVLADGETPAARNNAKGHLFEDFTALLLHEYGYEAPNTSDLNVHSDGIEIDVTAVAVISRHRAVVECKSYTSNVRAQACTSFLGKLQLARYEEDGDVYGYLFAIPRLVAEGEEVARKAMSKDKLFRYFNVTDIVDLLRKRRIISDAPRKNTTPYPFSDPAVIITEHGIFSCSKILDPHTHLANAVLVWGKEGAPVPEPVIELLKTDTYSAGLPVQSTQEADAEKHSLRLEESTPLTIVRVRGSSADFEYQLPASPEYFIGRGSTVQELESFVDQLTGSLVLNAQSGWGKSSLALQLKRIVDARGGYSIVVDSRTATVTRFVSEVLRVASHEAQELGHISLPEDSSWASLTSSLWTLKRAEWAAAKRPFLIFFDQFENVFQDEQITREFRDLTLMLRDSELPILIGFAWKTDLVAWTESHPFRLRDEIRSSSTFISVGPMRAREIETLLRRLERSLETQLSRDLRQRLREYSQGLPWLFKKLGGHIIRQLGVHGKSQEQLVSEGLNVQSLFDSDLAGLSPVESDALRHIARFAPVSAMEVTEKYNAGAIQSLLDSRLVVALAGKLDTYWDTFRDFLNTGRVPIEDSYIVRQSPRAVAELLFAVTAAGGDASVSDLSEELHVSTKVIYNRSREPRLFGLTAYEPNRVRILDDLLNAQDFETEMRRRVASALRRNKAYSAFLGLAERQGDGASISAYARELTNVFPAVDAQPQSWVMYARSFALWFHYSGLAILSRDTLQIPPDGYSPTTSLRGSRTQRSHRDSNGHSNAFVVRNPKAALDFLQRLAASPLSQEEMNSLPRNSRRAINEVIALGLAHRSNGLIILSEGVVDSSHQVSASALLDALRTVPGGSNALGRIERDPHVSSYELGAEIRDAIGAEWGQSTLFKVGKDFRSWAKRAGVEVLRARALEESREEDDRLF
ncbi:restriction endonuclease [Streptomyces sp. SHP 1-2]|uniref:restriction endonuclease n=1 Tax=Streptomyces sp. SHP 1-2 TaxID=2769489 RepID=UPI002238065E|nr:restriction endonuclease [Streptomyces sp. SHP 1-2]MCW5250107.1 restriction endonuclease [Streptomyces sp. SHP 1-2]